MNLSNEATPLAGLLAAYWSAGEVTTNLIVFMNLVGALVLGSLVGYERAYHGRAAGMRTYGLVCMASAGLTVISGYPGLWFGGQHAFSAVPDPTRVMQGIVTGIGFLGAGVIVKEGLNISGLTTAASIWAASCIGVLIGVGFYGAAILLAVLCAGTMMWGSKVEGWLPSHPAVHITLRYRPDEAASPSRLAEVFQTLGYQIAPGSFAITSNDGIRELRFVVVALVKQQAAALDAIAGELERSGAVGVCVGHARN